MKKNVEINGCVYAIEEEEITYCEHCGKPIDCGMIDGCGMHVCEECFPAYMDKEYGEGNWKDVDDDGCDGYYIVKEGDYWEGTGIFYTEWWDDFERVE